MKKTLKIMLYSVLSILALVIVVVAYFGAQIKWGSYSYDVENPVYAPGKQWDFVAEFIDSEGKTYKTDSIYLRVYKIGRFFSQNRMSWNSLKTVDDNSMDLTGIIENEDRTWLHPIRETEQYWAFTEYSPFPEIRKPYKIGNKWESRLQLGTYATKESGEKLQLSTSIVSAKEVDGAKEYLVSGNGISGLGKYSSEMVFHETKGFTRLEYTKANGEKLVLSLVRISDFVE